MEIKILHLYYDLMNLYGEYGNVRILERHLKDQGFDVQVEGKTLNEAKNFEDYDFIYIGAGTESNQKIIIEDLKNQKDEIKKIIDEGKIILATGNSFEVFGKAIDENEALNIFEFETETLKRRITTDVIAKSEIWNNAVVGFVNTETQLKNNNKNLFNIQWKHNKNLADTDGIIYNNFIGTHLIGPILERNPEILKYLITKIGKQKDENFEYKDIKYFDEEKGYELVLKELKNREEK